MSHPDQRFVYAGGPPAAHAAGGSPQRSAVTPLAYYSSITLSEHEDVQRQLDRVRQSASTKAAELENVAREHRRQRAAAMAELGREEEVLQAEMVSIQKVVATLTTATEKHFATDAADREEHDAEVAALQDELSSIAALEEDLKRLQVSIQERCSLASQQRATFIHEHERTAKEFTRAREDAARMGVQVNRVRATSPYRGRTSNLSFVTPHPPRDSPVRSPPRSPPRSPTTVVTPRSTAGRRFVSPTRHGSDPLSPSRVAAPSGGSPSRREGATSPSTAASRREKPLIHRLAAAGQVDDAITVVRQNPDAVHSLDEDANTPLHTACEAPTVSLELVNALLLAGASTTAKNDDGLTPFHLACLNTSDHGTHSLKKFLLFKAAVPPNQRSSRGETAAHLCARHDKHADALRYLSTAGVDLSIAALSGGDSENVGSPKRRTARETAEACGVRSRRCADILRAAESDS